MTTTGSGSQLGIPTAYRGTHFRSRLEAKWAAFFDLIGWSWIYEPMDADGYIPDFLIQGPRPFFVEVGAVYTTAEYIAKAEKADLAAASLGRDLLVVGMAAVADMLDACYPDVPSAGWLGEYDVWPGEWDGQRFGDGTPGFAWGRGNWGQCCADHLNVWHDFMNYDHRPWGHSREDTSARETWIMDRWFEAGNMVQWRHRTPR